MASTLLGLLILALLTCTSAFDVKDTCVAEGDSCVSDAVTANAMLQMKTKTDTPDSITATASASQGRPLETAASPMVQSHPCGFEEDCPQTYTLADVALMADTQFHHAAETNKKLRSFQVKMNDICRGMVDKNNAVLDDGAWCYERSESELVRAKPSEVDQDFLLPLHHVMPDPGFVSGVVQMLKKPDGSMYSIADFGAGVGQFGHVLKAHLPTLDYSGYDGAGNVEAFTNDYVKFFDLTKPLALPKADWVLSSEVGEHISPESEAQVIANLHAHNCKGIILTWAVLGQEGFHHINDHSNKYLKHVFTGLGYKFNEKATQLLRASVTSSPWLKRSTMVFERANRPTTGCE